MLVRPDDQAVGYEQRVEERPHAARPRPLDLIGALSAQRRLHRQREPGPHDPDLGGVERVRLLFLTVLLHTLARLADPASSSCPQLLHQDVLGSQRLGAERAAQLGRAAAHQLLGRPGASSPSRSTTVSPRVVQQLLTITTCSQTARVWEASRGETKAELRGHEHVVEVAVFAPPAAYPAIREVAGITVRLLSHLVLCAVERR